MQTVLPGTILPLPPGQQDHLFSVLEPILAVSGGGLQLSQVSQMTGLTATTIQNWVKRGWVEAPTNKKYGAQQVARILLINLLRPTMQLDQIVTLLGFINGRVDSRADDIIPEPQLYSLVGGLLLRLEQQEAITHRTIHDLVEQQLKDYTGPVPDAKSRLQTALELMLLNISAALLMASARTLYIERIQHTKEEGEGTAPLSEKEGDAK